APAMARPVPTMPAKAAAAAAPPPCRYTRRRALTSVTPLTAVAVERPCPDETEPARAGEGSTALIAIAATVAITAPRPIDENTPFRANILNILLVACLRQASQTNRPVLLRFPNRLAGSKDHETV